MLRYPEIKLPYDSADRTMLKQWSAEDPPGEHERHRNMEIQKAQGNRNPFIDHPEWVADFEPTR
jgi:endonuclease I